MTESTDKPLPDEQQLDEYLKGDSSVSRQYRQLHSSEVPAELDHLVLRQAHDAVKSRSSQRPAWVRWSVPLAVAASAVLALAIVIETGVREETMVASPAMQKREESIETRMIGEEPAAPHVPDSPASNMDDPQAVELRMPAPAATKQEAPPPVSSPAEAPSSPAQAPAGTPQVAARTSSAPAFVPEPEAVSRKSVANDAADAAIQKQNAAAHSAIQEQVAEAAQRDTEAFAAAAAREDERSTAQHTMLDEQNRGAGSRKAVDTRAPVAVYSRPISADMSAVPRTYSDPEAWLEDIRQLRKDNKQEEANREWRRFRTAFPNYEVAQTDPAREPVPSR